LRTQRTNESTLQTQLTQQPELKYRSGRCVSYSRVTSVACVACVARVALTCSGSGRCRCSGGATSTVNAVLVGPVLVIHVLRVQVCGVQMNPARPVARVEIHGHTRCYAGTVRLARFWRVIAAHLLSVHRVRVWQPRPRRRAVRCRR